MPEALTCDECGDSRAVAPDETASAAPGAPRLPATVETVAAPAPRADGAPAPSPARHRFAIRPDSLAQSMALLIVLTAVQRVVGFGRSILVCRWLSPQELGYWDLTLAFLDLAAPIAVFSLPACFSRYVEHYRQQGQLREFVFRVALATAGLALASMSLIYWQRNWFAELLYSESDRKGIELLLLATLVLPSVIVFNSVNEIFGGMRMFRAVTLLQFAQSLLFATFAVGLITMWHRSADSVLMGYGLTCVVCAILPVYWLTRTLNHLPGASASIGTATLWAKLLPFVGGVWVNNLLQNLFQTADRYMILHYAHLDDTMARAAVGQYYSARVVPTLIVQLAVVIGTMFVPYLSCDWESGRRHVVRDRLNTFLKLTGLTVLFAAVTILAASPILFERVFAGKYAAGQAILPLALLFAMWFSIYCIARIYLWCDERVWLASLGFVASLAVSVGANLLLLPRWGVHGAAVSAALASFTLMLTVYLLSMYRGLRIAGGTWIVSAAPAAICLGAWWAAAVLAALLLLAARTTLIFTQREKHEILELARDYQKRLAMLRRSARAARECPPFSPPAPLEESV